MNSSWSISPGGIISSNLVLIIGLLVIIDDFDIPRIALVPPETDPPLVIDADAMLAGPIPFKGFKMIPRRLGQVL